MEYLPYVLGMVAMYLFQLLGQRLGLKFPTSPDAPKLPQPGPSLPLPPMPDGKGSLLLWLLQLWEKYKSDPKSLTPEEKNELLIAWHITPEDEPE